MSPAKMPAFHVPRAKAFGHAKPRRAATGAKNVLLTFSMTRLSHLMLAALGLFCLAVSAFADAPRETQTLRVAVYDVPPYGYVDSDGSISGVSVDLWRRVAEQMEWPFRLIPISDMESIISGLEQGRFDAAIGAITITLERAARIDFSYPAHRSGVAIALRKETGPIFALMSYATAVSELTPLILVTVIMLIFIGIAMWIVERRVQSASQGSESSVVSLRDGLTGQSSEMPGDLIKSVT